MKWVFLCLAIVASGQTALRVSVKDELIELVADKIVPLGEKFLRNYPVGDIPLDFPGTSLGDIKLNLTDVKIVNVTLNEVTSNITLIDPKYIQIDLFSLELNISYNYSAHIGVLPQSTGTGTGVLKDTNATISVFLYTLESKTLGVGYNSSNVDIGSLSLDLSLNSITKRVINELIKSELSSINPLIESAISQIVPLVNLFLTSINYEYPIQVLNMKMDFHPTDNSTVTEESLTYSASGQVTNVKTGTSYPVDSVSVPSIDTSSTSQVQAFASQYILQSVIYCISGDIIEIKSLPSSFGIDLTTNGLAFLLPGLQNTYGKNKSVTLRIFYDSKQPKPVINVKEHSLKAEFDITIDLLVDVNGKLEQGVNLGLGTSLDLDASAMKSIASINIKDLKFTHLDYSNSNIGDVNVKLLLNFFNMIATALVQSVNIIYSSFELTVPSILGLEVAEIYLSLEDTYIDLGFDINIG